MRKTRVKRLREAYHARSGFTDIKSVRIKTIGDDDIQFMDDSDGIRLENLNNGVRIIFGRDGDRVIDFLNLPMQKTYYTHAELKFTPEFYQNNGANLSGPTKHYEELITELFCVTDNLEKEIKKLKKLLEAKG